MYKEHYVESLPDAIAEQPITYESDVHISEAFASIRRANSLDCPGVPPARIILCSPFLYANEVNAPRDFEFRDARRVSKTSFMFTLGAAATRALGFFISCFAFGAAGFLAAADFAAGGFLAHAAAGFLAHALEVFLAAAAFDAPRSLLAWTIIASISSTVPLSRRGFLGGGLSEISIFTTGLPAPAAGITLADGGIVIGERFPNN